MTPEDILTRVGDQLGIRRVFGEPIDRDGVTLVPVAVSIGGGGGGNGPEDQGSGGGFGGMVRGIGAYSISKGQVRFVPAVDTTALAALFVLAVGVVVRVRRRRAA
ncbi:sporulation protein [Nostocoides sp. F2B08]|uniref:sporulation protein n=1 Tax=Nostocoides sp. F2B08 TaxID=2653936 RepID=UPI001262EA76|nr:sporulation protein [Tetrasphaera sp. F2B08]KAB7745128.1 sporulation protein [Tetrasphaera sp. F2B08]